MKNSLVILIMLLLVWDDAVAQRIRNALGEAQFRLEEHMSKDELKEELRQQAIIKAIENTYGTAVTQDARIEMKDGRTRFNIEGTTTVRGEWLKTTSEKFSEEIRTIKTPEGKRMEIWIKCKIEGKVREVLNPAVVFRFSQGNCPDKKCVTTEFRNGEPMYVFFKAPVDGYLSIFIVEDDRAFRILPYQRMPAAYAHAIPVEGNKDYVFFSNYRSHDYFPDFSYYLADELLMVTEKKEETLRLFVIFSTEAFNAPLLEEKEIFENGEEIPKSLSLEMLKNWLENNRVYNTEFDFQTTTLKIIK